MGRALVCLALAATTIVVFWPVAGHDFVHLDDETYVTRNPHVRAGLTGEGLRWAWTTGYAANWHPLTWMSHMLDWQLFGEHARGHHLVSLALHALGTALLFLVLERATGRRGRSACVALLFGVHPLHVESVAWIAERKDVLSTVFWFLALYAYVRDASAPRLRTWILTGAAMAAGLCAKPMLVTLPFTLLLLDWWPLGRQRDIGRLVLEKLPLFALSAIASAVTFLVQQAGNAVPSSSLYPLPVRVSNALVAYASYLWKAFWPADLAAFYPHPRQVVPQAAAAALLLAAVTVVAVRQRRRWPWFLMGWLWYLGTLVPVIGLVQVGDQAMADRYTYVPLVGVFVAAVWGMAEAFPRARPVWLAVPAATVLLCLAVATRIQLRTWRDSLALFEHAVAVSEGSAMAHNGLGVSLMRLGRVDDAIAQYRRAVALSPSDAIPHNNLGLALAEREGPAAAVPHYLQAVSLKPDFAEAYNNLGGALFAQGQVEEAIDRYRRALSLDPNYPEAYNNLGVALARQKRTSDAMQAFSEAIRLMPDYAKAHANLAAALYTSGEYARAWAEIAIARRLGFAPPAPLVEALARKLPEPETR